jgi:hypothetical protein
MQVTLLCAAAAAGLARAASPTDGWTSVPFKYEIQHPYDQQENERYRYDSAADTHVFWILKSDKPHLPPPNHTAPRSEMRIFNEYKSGQHMFEADYWVVAGTDNTNIFQLFLTSQIRVFSPENGNARETFSHGSNSGTSLYAGAYEKWFNLKVEHDADAHVIKYYFDDQLVYTKKDNHSSPWYFKCGAYTVNDRSEVHVRNIKYWRKGEGVIAALPALTASRRAGKVILLPGDAVDPGLASGAIFDVTGKLQGGARLRVVATPLVAERPVYSADVRKMRIDTAQAQ